MTFQGEKKKNEKKIGRKFYVTPVENVTSPVYATLPLPSAVTSTYDPVLSITQRAKFQKNQFAVIHEDHTLQLEPRKKNQTKDDDPWDFGDIEDGTRNLQNTVNANDVNESTNKIDKEQSFGNEDKIEIDRKDEVIGIDDDNLLNNDKDEIIDNQNMDEVTKKFVVIKTPIVQSLSLIKNNNNKHSNTVQLPATETITKPSARSIFNRTSPLPSPHFDKRFFDSSLIEMKSQASSTSTLTDSLEDIWIRRFEFLDYKDFKGQSSEDSDAKSLNSAINVSSAKSTKSSYKGSRSASNSRSSSVERRILNDEQLSPKKASIETVVRPRSKSDVSKKKGNSFMSHMRNAMQQTGLMSMRMFKDGSAHPVKNCDTSDTKYYHTVTAAVSANHSRSAMTKVMDIFRNRNHVSASSEDRRKLKNIHQPFSLQSSHLRKLNFDAERRRQSFGTVHTRSSDLYIDPQHAAILFRDSRGLPVVDPFLEKVSKSEFQNEYQIYVKFFKFHTCYDLIPNSAKLVVFDTQLSVKKAFYALVYNGVRAAPLWDSEREEFVGMLTITDFIKILQMHYTSNIKTDELEDHKLESWRNQLNQNQPLISIGPENSLFDAIKILIENKIHRLPIIDPNTGDVLHILTHKRILKFLHLYINELPKPSYILKTLRNCNLGTYENIEVAYEDTTIITALNKFVKRRISALPIVDKDGKLIDIYAKFDVINLAANKTYNELDVTLRKANEHRNEWFEGVYRCKLDETLFSVIEKFVKFQVHRLVIVDDDEKVIGIISLSDLFKYLILNPIEDEPVENIEIKEKDSEPNSLDEDNVIITNEENNIETYNSDTNSNESNEIFSDNSAKSNSCLVEVAVTGGK